MYLPMLALMRPGDVFFTACDDLESFYVDLDQDMTEISREFQERPEGEPFLCSLAHPSTLAVGTGMDDCCSMSHLRQLCYFFLGHGVFRFTETDHHHLQTSLKSCHLITDCQEVLQKPSIPKMRERGMVVKIEDCEFVYTDSAYWINSTLVDLLIKFAENDQLGVMKVETSMYSDFMTCQGRSEEKEHLRHLQDCHFEVEPKEWSVKKSICKLMEEVPLLILALPNSK